jgi:hypothetical protein
LLEKIHPLLARIERLTAGAFYAGIPLPTMIYQSSFGKPYNRPPPPGPFIAAGTAFLERDVVLPVRAVKQPTRHGGST